MNYSESDEILSAIKGAGRILLQLHRNPDADSAGSALALYQALTNFGKRVDVVLTTKSSISPSLTFLPLMDKIAKVDFAKFDFKQYDLFITTDSGDWQQVVDDEAVPVPDIPIVVIDHHATNPKFGKINLIESEAPSCAEVVYKMLKDFGWEIDKTQASLLLAGIITDTGGFQFDRGSGTLKIASELVELGADKRDLVDKLLRTHAPEELLLWREYFSELKIDKENRFMWTAIPYATYKKYLNFPKASSSFSTQFASVVEGTDFGIVMTEKGHKRLSISFRSRGGFDISGLATELGGGGHKAAAGGEVLDLNFQDAVNKVLESARKYAKDHQKRT